MKSIEVSVPLNHLDYLDGWRGLAITFLLIGHFFPVPGINFGSIGVNLFFVLSGHLMGQLLFVKSTPIPLFYKRRFSRIIPAHVFFILCTILFFAVTEKPINWSETVAALLFVNNYFPGELGNAAMPFGHIWSLSVEEHSYILLSLVAIFSRKRKWMDGKWTVAGFTVLFTIVSYWYWYRYSGQALLGKQLHSEVTAYGIFVSAFLLLFIDKAKLPKLPAVVYPCLLTVGILMHWWSIPGTIGRTIGVGIFALTVNLLFCCAGYNQEDTLPQATKDDGAMVIFSLPVATTVLFGSSSQWHGKASCLVLGNCERNHILLLARETLSLIS